jgi:hypothetical protein
MEMEGIVKRVMIEAAPRRKDQRDVLGCDALCSGT